jgi:hypothetical protein
MVTLYYVCTHSNHPSQKESITSSIVTATSLGMYVLLICTTDLLTLCSYDVFHCPDVENDLSAVATIGWAALVFKSMERHG